MTRTRTITIEVPEEVALRMDAEVAAGHYSDAGDLVTESVRSQLHQSRYDGSDPEIERWLEEQVKPTYQRWQREKKPGIPAEEVLKRLKARRADGTKLA